MRSLIVILIFFSSVASIAWLTVRFSRQSENISLAANTLPGGTDDVTGDMRTPPTTPLPKPAATPEPISLLFGGDVMLDRHIREKASKTGYTYILEDFRELAQKSDALIVNLEGPVTDFPSKSIGSAVGSSNNFLFTFEPQVADFLNEYSISIVNLGNNHILNFGAAGLSQTYDYLDAANIQHFGFVGESERSSTLITTIKGTRFGFVNYNQFIPGGYERALSDIADIRSQVDVLIMQPHWGLEYKPIANEVIQTQAHAFIDAGVDLIMGAHPHVVQQSEVYNGKTIYYSLGNFVFDQYFEEAVRKGKLVEVRFDPATLVPTFTEFDTWLEKDGSTSLQF